MTKEAAGLSNSEKLKGRSKAAGYWLPESPAAPAFAKATARQAFARVTGYWLLGRVIREENSADTAASTEIGDRKSEDGGRPEVGDVDQLHPRGGSGVLREQFRAYAFLDCPVGWNSLFAPGRPRSSGLRNIYQLHPRARCGVEREQCSKTGAYGRLPLKLDSISRRQ
jgi:hypothetical protein